jgi:hypothetical protein
MKSAKLLLLATAMVVLTMGRVEAQIQSDTTGVWSSPATWVGGVVPTATDNVEIVSGHTVTVDVSNAECNSLIALGYLYFDILNTGFKLTVHGDVTVGPAGRIRSGGGTPTAPRAHELVLEQHLTVALGGNFDMRIGSGANVSVGRVVFAGSSNSLINLSLTTYTSNAEEFNSVIINKTGGAKVILAGGNLFQNNNSTNSPDTLVLISGVIETGTNHWVILRTSSSSILGSSSSSYVHGILGRGISNGGGLSTIDFPVGDSANYRLVNVRLVAPANATGHYVWAKLHRGNANTGSSTFAGGIDKVSAARYFEVGYLQNQGSSSTMGFYGFGPSYGTNDGVAVGNTDLRAAYSTDNRATWTNHGPTDHLTDLTNPPTTIRGDSLTSNITLTTGTSLFVSLARLTGTTTNSLEDPGTGVGDDQFGPSVFTLRQNYPNPFNPKTQIEFTVSERSHVTIAIFNVIGQEIAVLVDGIVSPGTQTVTWNGTDAAGRSVPSGIYLYRMSTGTHQQTLKALLLK